MQWGGQLAATGMVAAKVRRSSGSSKPTFPSLPVPLPFVLPCWAIGLQACPSDADKYQPNCFKIATKTKTNYDCVSNCEDKWFLQHSKSPLYCPSPDSACIDSGFLDWATHYFQIHHGKPFRKYQASTCNCNYLSCR